MSPIVIGALSDEPCQRQLDALRLVLGDVRDFLDITVREWLPSEHPACDPTACAHAGMEREMYDELDRMVAWLAAPQP
jgi:hypothetical protein